MITGAVARWRVILVSKRNNKLNVCIIISLLGESYMSLF